MEKDWQLFRRFMRVLNFTGQWTATLNDTAEMPDIFRRVLDRTGEVRLLDDEITFQAESPWQAAMWLFIRSFILADPTFMPELRQQRAQELGLNNLGVTLTIFRGQGDPTWGLLPGINRDPQRMIHFNRTVDLFIRMLRMAFREVLPELEIEEISLRAIAQHYKLRTNLLDWTTDPEVAVYFATQQAADSPDAVVYSIPLQNHINDGLEICLPPGMAHRLFLQRGVFLQLPEARLRQLREQSTRIIFPKSLEFRLGRSNTDDGAEVSILPPNSKINRLRHLARYLALKFPVDLDLDLLNSELQCAVTRSRIVQKLRTERNIIESWLEDINLMLEQLVISRTENRTNVALEVALAVARNNVNALSLFAPGQRILGLGGNIVGEILAWACVRTQISNNDFQIEALPENARRLINQEAFEDYLIQAFGAEIL